MILLTHRQRLCVGNFRILQRRPGDVRRRVDEVTMANESLVGIQRAYVVVEKPETFVWRGV